MASITDTTPRNQHLGTKDEGGRLVYPQPKKESLWKPKVYAFTSKGDTNITYDVTGDEFKVLFGAETLDPRSKYFNHQLYMANKVFKAGGSIVFQKLNVPENTESITLSKPSVAAGLTMYAMVAEKDIPKYKRDIDGKFVMPMVQDGAAEDEVVPGFEIAFVALDKVDAPIIEAANTLNGVATTMYPLFSLESIGQNEVYNKYGFTIKPQVGLDNDEEVLDKIKAFQVNLGIVTKETGEVKKFNNLLGLGEVTTTFKEFAVNPRTNEAMSVEDVFPNKWSNLTNTELPIIAAPFKHVEIHDGIKALSTLLAEKEKAYLVAEGKEVLYSLGNAEWSVEDRRDAFNWLSFVDPESENPYFTSVIAGTPAVEWDMASNYEMSGKVVDLSERTPVYLRGGEDGEVDNLETYERALLMKIAEYEDRDSLVQSIPLNEENVFVDTGFTLNTSLKLPMLQTYRADIEVILATYEFDSKDRDGVNIPRDITSAALLRNALSLTPESKEYNTPSSRGTIVQGCGKDDDGIYPYLIPNTIELAWQSANYMGGKEWNARYKFGGQPGSFFTALTDCRPLDLPFSVKSKLHNTGVMYAEVEDRGRRFFPSYQGIYADKTSPLSSYHTNILLTYFVKLHHRMWRKYTGRKDLTQGELKDLIEADMREAIPVTRFNNEFTELIPEVFFLEYDTQVGHIWRQRIYTYSENERMVAISDNVVRRASDLEGGN